MPNTTFGPCNISPDYFGIYKDMTDVFLSLDVVVTIIIIRFYLPDVYQGNHAIMFPFA